MVLFKDVFLVGEKVFQISDGCAVWCNLIFIGLFIYSNVFLFVLLFASDNEK